MLLCLYPNFLCCYTLYNICVRQQDAKVSRFIRKPLFRGVILDFFLKKVATFVCSSKKSRTFAHAIERQRIAILGYGVMVTLQILVLSFLVRVRVSQHKDNFSKRKVVFFFV